MNLVITEKCTQLLSSKPKDNMSIDDFLECINYVVYKKVNIDKWKFNVKCNELIPANTQWKAVEHKRWYVKTNEHEPTKKKATYLKYIYVVRMCNAHCTMCTHTHTLVYIHRMSENKSVAYSQCLSNKQNKNCRFFFVTACFISIKSISDDLFRMQTLFWCFHLWMNFTSIFRLEIHIQWFWGSTNQ